MILDVSKGHIKVKIGERIVTVPGEMFFPPNDKMGFAIFEKDIKFWDFPYDEEALTPNEIKEVIADIQQDFTKGGHTLEIE